MFPVPTVLVLGAGASWHYGYPLGEDLIDSVIRDASKTDSINYSYRLADQLKFYDPISIDSFLNYWGEDENVANTGKVHIARALLKCEKKKHFQRNHQEYDAFKEKSYCRGNWYKFLANAIIGSVGNDYCKLLTAPLNLSIITFNYDLSLEYYLYSRFIRIPTFNKDQISEFLAKINDSIFHFYGQIGKFKWQGGTRENEEYGRYCDPGFSNADDWLNYNAANLSRELVLMGQRTEASYTHIHQKLSEAKKIYFLGFGFNNDNVNLLALEQTCKKSPEIFYTNFGNSDLITNLAKQHLFRNFITDGGNTIERGGSSSRLFVSQKTVYDALKYDFSLT